MSKKFPKTLFVREERCRDDRFLVSTRDVNDFGTVGVTETVAVYKLEGTQKVKGVMKKSKLKK